VTILNKTAVTIESPPPIKKLRELSQPTQIGITAWKDSTISHHMKPNDIPSRARANTGFLPILFPLLSRYFISYKSNIPIGSDSPWQRGQDTHDRFKHTQNAKCKRHLPLDLRLLAHFFIDRFRGRMLVILSTNGIFYQSGERDIGEGC